MLFRPIDGDLWKEIGYVVFELGGFGGGGQMSRLEIQN